ncbi:MAG: hydroxymethylglutaryl-CoA lyase [Cytophagales bacterium]|nr:MAG: hydroxymethylglutaryl-CoA lyase [Cytophagales bacterium]
MQGIREWIPTEVKTQYINQLLQVGFDAIDFGSFVSPKVIPQMKDTAEVLGKLDLSVTKTKLLAITASVNGAKTAIQYPEIDYLGFPLSASETFQIRNTNKNSKQSMDSVREIQEMCLQTNKQLLVYISMGFGNPYGDPFDGDIVENFAYQLNEIGVKIIMLSDTIGVSEPDLIVDLFTKLNPAFPNIEFGAHFHSNPKTAIQKIEAASQAGCKRFDGAIGGFGGCPMAKDELTGNIATEKMIQYFLEKKIDLALDLTAFGNAVETSREIFIYENEGIV